MGDPQVFLGQLITRRDVLRAGVVGLGTIGLVTTESLAGWLSGSASAATVRPPQWGAPSLVASVPLDGAWFIQQLAVADFNGDGHQDVLIARSSMDAEHAYPVTVLLGDGKGNFTDGTSSVFEGDIPQTQFPRQIVIADFNGDGRPDVFIADTGDDHSPGPGYQNTLILSAPDGKLVDATANLPQIYDFTHSAAVADVDGNGTLDIYVGNVYGENLVPPRILLNDGKGNFTLGVGLLPADFADLNQNQYTGSTFADVNGDGHPDLVLAGNTGSQSVVLLNDGTGHFTLLPSVLPPKPFAPDANGLGPISFDINGDGHPDLLIGFTQQNPFYVGRWIQVLINNGDGTFSDQTSTYLPQSDNSEPWPVFFRVADLQRTGRLDFGLVAAGDSARLYLRDPNGYFVSGPAINAGANPGSTIGGFSMWSFVDSTGDGSNDIIGLTGAGQVWLVPEIRADTLAPALSHLNLTPAAFLAAHSGARVARAGTGTIISYTVTEASTTTFTVQHETAGGTFIPLNGSFTHRGAAGTNHFRFTGRIGRRTLRAGRYRLNATPKNTAGLIGKTRRTEFRVLP